MTLHSLELARDTRALSSDVRLVRVCDVRAFAVRVMAEVEHSGAYRDTGHPDSEYARVLTDFMLCLQDIDASPPPRKPKDPSP